jgi:hypothetical protein
LNTIYLVDEPPGSSDALLDVADKPIAGLEGGIVVEGGPDLITHVLADDTNVNKRIIFYYSM